MPEAALSKMELEYERCYAKGTALLEGQIHIHGVPCKKLGWLSRWRIKKAIRLLEQATALNGKSWPAMWFLGKAYQRLELPKPALEWFSRAHQINPTNPDVLREASFAAADAGLLDWAVEFSRRATIVTPKDAGLHANLALALLFSENLAEAAKSAEDALALAPSDPINQRIDLLVKEVLAGKRKPPKHVREI